MNAPAASLATLSLFGIFAACSDLATPVDPMSSAGTHAGGQSAHAGASGTGNPNAGTTGHAGSGSGGTAAHAGSSNKAGNGGSGGDAGSTEESVLSLTSVDAHVVGRDGNAVRFTVQGTRSSAGVSSIAVTFEDADGTPVPMFDAAFDGKLEGTDGRIVFDAPITSDSFTATATLSGIKDTSKLVKAKVNLVDGADALSEVIEVTIGAQAVLALGAACDAKTVMNRCDAGQSCSGTPSKCAAGVVPTLTEVKYLHAPVGGTPLILMRGTDPDDDMGAFFIELLTAANTPVTVDADTNPYSTVDVKFGKLSALGSFFGSVQPASTFETNVPRVRVTPIDSLNHQGTPLSVSISSVSHAADGQTCDPRGFSGCLDTSLCVPGLTPTTGKCTKVSTAHATACAAAPKLDPDAGATSIAGRMAAGSLWEPPTGCVSSEKMGRPEAAVTLHLATAAKTLTLTTHRPETNIDTVLYLLPGCADTTELDWCNDDETDYTSTLTLSNVAAGDYTVIVESAQLGGGSFGLSVATK